MSFLSRDKSTVRCKVVAQGLSKLTGARLKRNWGHTRSCTSLAFSKSGGHLATSSLGGEIIVWPSDDEADMTTVPLVVESIDWCPTTNMVVAAVGPLVMFWDINSGARYGYCLTRNKEEAVNYVKFTPAGDSILTGISNVSYRYTPRQTLAAIDTEAKTANNDSDDELDSSSHGVIRLIGPILMWPPSIQPGVPAGNIVPLRQVEPNFNFQLPIEPDLSYADDDDDEIKLVKLSSKRGPIYREKLIAFWRFGDQLKRKNENFSEEPKTPKKKRTQDPVQSTMEVPESAEIVQSTMEVPESVKDCTKHHGGA
ncbi:hypothetical protein TNCV_3127731 [Trichonephila clavipes]|nr:hypothetical protein TNCV_3127731 [Trichonephila clavipes]